MLRTILRPICQATPRITTRITAATIRKAYSTTFDWQDPLQLTGTLTDEEVAISNAAREYCQERVLPRVLRMRTVFNCYDGGWGADRICGEMKRGIP